MGRDVSQRPFRLVRAISIHAPAWGATYPVNKMGAYVCISIHAPAWGATLNSLWILHQIAISIHAPAWGATAPKSLSGKSTAHFNPRARVGRDNQRRHGSSLDNISIHAPAWGATRGHLDPRFGKDISIHAPAWGATTAELLHKLVNDISIHAPAWGATALIVILLHVV